MRFYSHVEVEEMRQGWVAFWIIVLSLHVGLVVIDNFELDIWSVFGLSISIGMLVYYLLPKNKEVIRNE